MATWDAAPGGGEVTYSEDTSDDFRNPPMGRTVGDAGGRVMPVIYNDDTSQILVNENNDIEIPGGRR